MTNYEAGQVAGRQAVERFVVAGRQLMAAKFQGLNFTDFVRDRCNGLSRSRAYELIAIANGKVDEVRANSNARKRRHRLAQRVAAAKDCVRSGTDTKSAKRTLSVFEEFKEAVDVLFPIMDADTCQRAKSYVKEWYEDCDSSEESPPSLQ
jgi:hypothetical protein